MPRYGRNRRRLERNDIQILSHPVRIGILDLFRRNEGRSLAASDLRATLIAEDRDTFGDFSVSQIAYHRTRLQDAELIPAG